MHDGKGFTLIELMLVMTMLGIMAAIVIPALADMSSDARESALASDLQTLRTQIELYKIQHLDCQPGDTDDNGVADDADDFVADLTGRTDLDGSSGTALGPYTPSFPPNPFLEDDDTVKVGDGSDIGSGTQGWYFNTTDGQISPNDSSHTNL